MLNVLGYTCPIYHLCAHKNTLIFFRTTISSTAMRISRHYTWIHSRIVRLTDCYFWRCSHHNEKHVLFCKIYTRTHKLFLSFSWHIIQLCETRAWLWAKCQNKSFELYNKWNLFMFGSSLTYFVSHTRTESEEAPKRSALH